MFDWSHINFPIFESSDEKYFPFYYPQDENKEIVYEITNFDKTKNQDCCIDINYFVTQNAKLIIKYNNRKVFELLPTYGKENSKIDWTPIVNKEEEYAHRICIQDLVPNVDPKFTVSLQGVFANEDLVSVQLSQNLKCSERAAPISLPYIISNSFKGNEKDPNFYIKHQFKNQWTLYFPKNVWKFSNDLTTLKSTILEGKTSFC